VIYTTYKVNIKQAGSTDAYDLQVCFKKWPRTVIRPQTVQIEPPHLSEICVILFDLKYV